MSLIRCPECGNSISDRAEKCPHCGLPASYFSSLIKNASHTEEPGLDYKNLQNVLISFERDHAQLFSAEHYISHRDAQRLRDTYGKYSESLNNKLIFRNRSIIPRYRKVVVPGTHTAENHDFISSDQGSRSSILKSLFCSARSGIILSR